MATDELAEKLHRRLDLQDRAQPPRQPRVFNPHTEFKEFSRKQIRDMEQMFKRSTRVHLRAHWHPSTSDNASFVFMFVCEAESVSREAVMKCMFDANTAPSSPQRW
ncbi:hypothetical protein MHYP_G00206190 [Metynnis hypsauchen]